VTRCSNIAVVKVTEVTEMIKTALDSDAAARATGSVAMVTSAAASAADSVNMSAAETHSDTVDMTAAREKAATLRKADVDDINSSSSSVIALDSVPAVDVVDAGTYSLCLFTGVATVFTLIYSIARCSVTYWVLCATRLSIACRQRMWKASGSAQTFIPLG